MHEARCCLQVASFPSGTVSTPVFLEISLKDMGLAILTYIDRGQSPSRILVFFVNAKIGMNESASRRSGFVINNRLLHV